MAGRPPAVPAVDYDGKCGCVGGAWRVWTLRPCRKAKLGNPNIPAEFSKWSTRTFQCPSSDFKAHFYKKPTTGEVFQALDYKNKNQLTSSPSVAQLKMIVRPEHSDWKQPIAAQPLPRRGRATLGRYFTYSRCKPPCLTTASAAPTLPPRIAVFGLICLTAIVATGMN
jgi:hypothetical protein